MPRHSKETSQKYSKSDQFIGYSNPQKGYGTKRLNSEHFTTQTFRPNPYELSRINLIQNRKTPYKKPILVMPVNTLREKASPSLTRGSPNSSTYN